MEKLYMFQARFGIVDEFIFWNMERIRTNVGRQFISKEFQEGLSVCGVRLSFVAQDHQDMNAPN